MQIIPLLIIGGLVFLVCFLVDKGFSMLFRGKQQHRSGLAVKLNKRYALFGLALAILGILGILAGANGPVLLYGGIAVLLMGGALLVYYLSFGVYYDEETFLMSTIGKKSTAYRYSDIVGQKLYTVTGGSILVELHMADGHSLGLQSSMEGSFPFLDYAFSAWCRQKKLDPECCDFHDPSNSRWFPKVEEA